MAEYESLLTTGILLKRYKRFLADICLDSGETVTAHVPNTGAMLSTKAAGSKVAVSYHSEPHRKLKWTLELVQSDGTWVGVNTFRSNYMVEEAIAANKIRPLCGKWHIRREVKYGNNSRIDLLLERESIRCYVEVKNVTYKEGLGAYFPDAITERGKKHLRELMKMVQDGHQAVIFFLVNRNDCNFMAPAAHIDPAYAHELNNAIKNGVVALAYRFTQNVYGYCIEKKIPIRLSASCSL